MKTYTGLGIGIGLNGREAAQQAVKQALDQISNTQPTLAIAFISQEYDIQEVMDGFSIFLANTPIWYTTTALPFTFNGENPRSIIITIITKQDIEASINWFPITSNQDIEKICHYLSIIKNIEVDDMKTKGILFNGNALLFQNHLEQIFTSIHPSPFTISGCLTTSNWSSIDSPNYNQVHIKEGVAFLSLKGNIGLNVSAATGWHSTGLRFRITELQENTILSLDDVSPAIKFEEILGFKSSLWTLPPLNELVRLYALGFPSASIASNMSIRSPVRVQTDGSFLLNMPVQKDQICFLFTGDIDSCLDSIEIAIEKTLKKLSSNSRPILAIIWLDISWKYLFEGKTKKLYNTIQEKLKEIPLMGAYTLGQIAYSSENNIAEAQNQHFQITILSEETANNINTPKN